MFDGAELVKAIAANPGGVELLDRDEIISFPAARPKAERKGSILKLCLGPNAPQSLVDMRTSHQPFGEVM